MPRYWVIAPLAANPSADFDAVLRHDLAQGCISIGWEDIGPIDGMNLADVYARVSNMRQGYSKAQVTRLANMLWNFHNEIGPGDVVIARRGRRTIEAIGKADGKGRFVSDNSMRAPGVSYDHNRVISVVWDRSAQRIQFPNIEFGMQTIYEVGEEKYQEWMAERSKVEEGEDESSSYQQVEFALEKYLEDFIVRNFEKIFEGKLSIYHDPVDNVEGQQFSIDVGVIDILARDQSTSDLVVIELKKGRAADRVVGQILRYMGWVQQNLAVNGEGVRGLVICKEPDERLAYATAMAPNITTKSYHIDFKLKDAV